MVTYIIQGQKYDGIILNMSHRGALIQTRNAFPSIDATLTLTFEVENMRRPLRINAVVMHHSQRAPNGIQKGFGVCFRLPEHPMRAREVRAFIQSYL